MKNLLNQDEYLNEGETAFQRLVTNLNNYSHGLKSKAGGDLGDDVLATLGNIIGSVTNKAKPIADDFGFGWVDKKRDLNYYSRNRNRLINRWERENLQNNKRYSDVEIENIRKDFDEKARGRFGKSYNFMKPGEKATPEQQVWSDYAVNILKKYTKNRRA